MKMVLETKEKGQPWLVVSEGSTLIGYVGLFDFTWNNITETTKAAAARKKYVINKIVQLFNESECSK